MPDRRQTILMALFDRVAEMQRAGTLQPIAEDYQQLLTAAEPSDPGDTTAGPRFAAALIQLAANALVRLTDLQDTGLGNILHTAAPEAAPTDHRSAARCHPECGAWAVGPEDIVLSVSDTGRLVADITPERVAGIPPCFIRQSAFPVGARTAVAEVLSTFNKHRPNRKRAPGVARSAT